MENMSHYRFFLFLFCFVCLLSLLVCLFVCVYFLICLFLGVQAVLLFTQRYPQTSKTQLTFRPRRTLVDLVHRRQLTPCSIFNICVCDSIRHLEYKLAVIVIEKWVKCCCCCFSVLVWQYAVVKYDQTANKYRRSKKSSGS